MHRLQPDMQRYLKAPQAPQASCLTLAKLACCCYARQVAHSLPWTKYSCHGTPSAGLIDLAATHRRLHPGGKAAPSSLFNRCHERLRQTLEELMHYCWAPALAAADAVAAASAGGEGSSSSSSIHSGGAAAGDAAAKLNHTWPVVIEKLEEARAQHVPLFRFS